MSALDDSIDDLYKGPLGDFTASRNALAKTLKADEAKRVKALAKPTLVAWAVNQLHWHAPKTYKRLLDSGAALRKAQIAALSGKNAAVRESTEAHRAAVTDAAREANRLGGLGAPHLEPLTRTLETLSLAPEPPEPHGRLTEVLQPAGFEALAGVTPAGPKLVPREAPHKKPEPAAKKSAAETNKEAAEAKQREAEAKQREAEIHKAEAVVERAKAAESLARQALDRATRERQDAEARLKALQ